MNVKSLSATSIKDFLQCRLKLLLRTDKSIPSIRGDHARLGTAVHEALDQLSKRMKAKASFPDQADHDFAVSVFMNKAVEEGLQDMSFYRDGRNMITSWVDRFDPSEKVIESEYRFRLETPEGVPIAGAIDKVVELSPDTICIVDYKTSRAALTQHELDDDIQLSMYDLAASVLWPQYKYRVLKLEYVRIDKRVETRRTDEDRLMFREFLKSLWLNINSIPEEEMLGRLNSLCGWCDYRSYCPEYAKMVSNDRLVLPLISDTSDGGFLQQWEYVAAAKTTIEARQRELKMAAHEKLMQGASIAAAGKELSATQNSRTSYTTEDIVDIVPGKDLLSVLSVNKSRLDAYAREDAGMRSKLSRVAQVSYNAPVYRIRDLRSGGTDEDFPGYNDETAGASE